MLYFEDHNDLLVQNYNVTVSDQLTIVYVAFLCTNDVLLALDSSFIF